MNTTDIGTVLFGIVIGWITYRTLVRRTDAVQLSDIATVLAAVGGGAVTGLFDSQHLFGLYSIGLAAGFFGYLALFFVVNGKDEGAKVMGDGDKPVKLS